MFWSFYITSSGCSAQGQVFQCKFKYQGCCSVQRKVFHRNSGIKVAILLGMNRCGSFPLLSAPHSLFSIWTDFKRPEKIPGAPAWRWGEWVWLTGLSGLHRNPPQRLNTVSLPSGFLTWSEIRKSQSAFAPVTSTESDIYLRCTKKFSYQ